MDLMKEYAALHSVPIIEDDGLEILIKVLEYKKPKSILEIGSAIGYSSINMALNSDAIITTVERDIDYYIHLKNNIKRFNLEDRIKPLLGDGLMIDMSNFTKYDLIYIDAAKAQNIKFFNRYKDLLNNDGFIVFDNLLFHGFVNKNMSEIPTKNVRQLVRKIKGFLTYISDLEGYNFKLIEQGDGIGIVYKKGIYE